MILLVALLGACASLVTATKGGFQFRNMTMEADNGSLVIFADQIIVSGQIIPAVVDNKNMVIQEISEMHAINLRTIKVGPEGVLEIKAAEGSGTSIIVKIDVDALENVGMGSFLKLLAENNITLTLRNLIVKNLELPVAYVSNQTITLYGMEVSLG